MKDLFLSDKKFLMYYTGLWLISTAGLFVLFIRFTAWDYLVITLDSLITSTLFFLVFLSLWYVVRFAGGYSAQSPDKLLSTLFAGAFLVAIWVFLAYQLLNVIGAHWEGYQVFLRETLWLRALLGFIMAIIVNLLFYNFFLIKYNQQAIDRETELKELVQRTELQAFKNQLNPHFIYNSLNSISSLTLTAPEKAREMVIRLSDFLRYALKQDATQMTSLEKELENIEAYLAIEKVRFGNKLEYCFKFDPLLKNIAMPVMILQPLFENAVKHGVQNNSEPTQLVFSTESSGSEVKLSLQNVYDGQFTRFRSEGIGIENIRNRLRILYGNGNLLALKAQSGVFTAILSLPKIEYQEKEISAD